MKRLKLHMDKHLIEKKTFPCSTCQKVFRSFANLEKHTANCESKMKIPNIDTTNTTTSAEYNNALKFMAYHRYGTLNGFSGHTTT